MNVEGSGVQGEAGEFLIFGANPGAINAHGAGGGFGAIDRLALIHIDRGDLDHLGLLVVGAELGTVIKDIGFIGHPAVIQGAAGVVNPTQAGFPFTGVAVNRIKLAIIGPSRGTEGGPTIGKRWGDIIPAPPVPDFDGSFISAEVVRLTRGKIGIAGRQRIRKTSDSKVINAH